MPRSTEGCAAPRSIVRTREGRTRLRLGGGRHPGGAQLLRPVGCSGGVQRLLAPPVRRLRRLARRGGAHRADCGPGGLRRHTRLERARGMLTSRNRAAVAARVSFSVAAGGGGTTARRHLGARFSPVQHATGASPPRHARAQLRRRAIRAAQATRQRRDVTRARGGARDATLRPRRVCARSAARSTHAAAAEAQLLRDISAAAPHAAVPARAAQCTWPGQLPPHRSAQAACLQRGAGEHAACGGSRALRAGKRRGERRWRHSGGNDVRRGDTRVKAAQRRVVASPRK